MREEPLAIATRALARREHSRRSLRERLQRAGVGESELEDALAELERVGLLDDARFARERARVLAERGKGDAAIRFDLERAGVGTAEVEDALAELEPERERAERLIGHRGGGPATARLLAGRGFDDDVVAAVVAQEQ
jgi:regulatory protein